MTEQDLHPIAVEIGEAWAQETIRTLRSERRAVIGAWPGTIGEARMRIRVVLRRKLDLEQLDGLARVAYVAARRNWHGLAEPDLEP
jgi:hypothetical protein